MVTGEPIVILLVEDDPSHAEIVKRNLESSRIGNRIIHIQDGQAALDYFFRETETRDPADHPWPHLILLDLRLPKVDGLDVLEKLRTHPETSGIPVVILTTSDAESDIARAYKYNANSYLVKPIDFSKFVDLLKTFDFYWLIWNQFPKR
jgi:DNA-binding response OmpR family regulator